MSIWNTEINQSLLNLGKHSLDATLKDKTEFVQIAATGTAIEQRHTQLLFKLCDGLGDGGL
jgi:hypothetical protein